MDTQLQQQNQRHRHDLNLRVQSPLDFKSNAITTQPPQHDVLTTITINNTNTINII